jgi:NADH-quinone oxidoreductase subunit N
MNILIIASVLGIVTMMSEIFGYKKYIWHIIVSALLGMLFLNINDIGTAQYYYNEMILVDSFSNSFSSLLIVLCLIWFLISKNLSEESEFNLSDQYAQIIFSLTGALILTCYSNLSMLFLGVEILSIPLYILAGSRKKDLASNEASLKYFMMGAFATGFLLFGITLIYGVVGSFNLGLIQHYTSMLSIAETPTIFYAGIVLIFIGLGFKVAIFPMHFWTPDVYEGTPILTTSYMASIVKTAAFAGFFKLYYTCFATIGSHLNTTIVLIASFTILIGNLIATNQTNMKRLLAYSGIAQSGYILLFFLIPNIQSANGLFLYLFSYAISTMTSFGIVYWLIKVKGNDSISSLSGLGKSNPILSFVLTISLLSLSGIPPTIGFFAKFNLFKSLIQAGYLPLVIVAVIGSLISVYYYFKAIIQIYASVNDVDTIAQTNLSVSTFYKIVFSIISLLIIISGITPAYFLDLITQ